VSDIADNPSENDVTPMETDHPPNEIEEGNRTELKLKRANAFYILRTKEVNLLTQKCVDDIVLGTGELIRSTVETVAWERRTGMFEQRRNTMRNSSWPSRVVCSK
jgi:hypothetical protein